MDGRFLRKYEGVSDMRKIFYQGTMVILMVFMTSFSMAQELGGSGGAAGMISENNSIGSSGAKTKGLLSPGYEPIIDVGSPIINADEGIFVWLDENQTWKVRWQGEPGQFVWVRLKAENYITDIMPLSEEIKTEMRGNLILTITGTTTAELTGVSFKSETPEIDIDAKWNMIRNVNKVYLSGQKEKLAMLPSVIKVPGFDGVNIEGMSATSTGKNVRGQISSTISKGRGLQGTLN